MSKVIFSSIFKPVDITENRGLAYLISSNFFLRAQIGVFWCNANFFLGGGIAMWRMWKWMLIEVSPLLKMLIKQCSPMVMLPLIMLQKTKSSLLPFLFTIWNSTELNSKTFSHSFIASFVIPLLKKGKRSFQEAENGNYGSVSQKLFQMFGYWNVQCLSIGWVLQDVTAEKPVWN